MDGYKDTLLTRMPTAHRPLLGLTVLVVEDSRIASEAVRLLCLRSGARIRRADSLTTAARHLAVYRPTVVLVDLGLPDGSGLDLIAQLAATRPRIPVILGISGDTAQAPQVTAAGADGFIAKPVAHIAAFQAAILEHLPEQMQPPIRMVSDDRITPDPIAYRDDLVHIADLLAREDAAASLDYVTQYLASVVQSAGDTDLAPQLAALPPASGAAAQPQVKALSRLLRQRLRNTAPL